MADQPNIALPDARAIANKTLILLGSAVRIDTFEERDGTEASELLRLWDIARRAALVLHPFNFALTRAVVEREAEAPVGASFAFRLPTDCLRWLPWDRSSSRWFDAVEEGGMLLTDNEGPILVRYIRDARETPLWSPLFVDVMSYQLAIEYCEAKTKLQGLRDRLTVERDNKLSDAKRVDGLASPNRPRAPAVAHSRWAGARFRPGGTSWR